MEFLSLVLQGLVDTVNLTVILKNKGESWVIGAYRHVKRILNVLFRIRCSQATNV